MRNQIDIVNTSRYPLDELRELIQIARGEKQHGHVAMNVKNSESMSAGRAYSYMPSVSKRSRYHHRGAAKSRRYLVVARIGGPEHFPLTYQYRGLSTATRYELRTWQEAFVALVSHELMHCVQFRTNSPGSEIEAERAAVWALERYRKTAGKMEFTTEIKLGADIAAERDSFQQVCKQMVHVIQQVNDDYIERLTESTTP